jgi:hypothetical protein
VHELAAELDRLLQQQQQQPLLLLGRRVLLLPPWLQLTARQQAAQLVQQQQQGDSQQQQQQQQGPCVSLQDSKAAAAAVQYAVVLDTSSSSSSEQAQFVQGAAAGLIALVAVWLGAKRVYACLPSSSSSSVAGFGAYEAGFSAVVQLNECRVVVERIPQRRWVYGFKLESVSLAMTNRLR